MSRSPASELIALRWAKEVTPEARAAATAPARAALDRKWEDHVDPDRQLDPAERERQAAEARRQYFAELGRRSAAARRARAAQREAEAA